METQLFWKLCPVTTRLETIAKREDNNIGENIRKPKVFFGTKDLDTVLDLDSFNV
jgi:hypothetical protein